MSVIRSTLPWIATEGQAHAPIFLNGSDWYVILCDDGTDGPQAYKATDPTGTWTVQDTSNNPATTGQTVEAFSVIQDGTSLYVFWHDLSAKLIYIEEFDMATDTWDGTHVTVDGAFTNSNSHPAVDAALRSDGDIIAVYSGEPYRTMGKNYPRVEARVQTGAWNATWSATVLQIDDLGAVTETAYLQNCVLGASDRTHVLWLDTSATNELSLTIISSTDGLARAEVMADGAPSDLGTTGSFTYGAVGVGSRSSVAQIFVVRQSGAAQRIADNSDTPSTSGSWTAQTNEALQAGDADPSGGDFEKYLYSFANDGDTTYLGCIGDAATGVSLDGWHDNDQGSDSGWGSNQTEFDDAITGHALDLSVISSKLRIVWSTSTGWEYGEVALGGDTEATPTVVTGIGEVPAPATSSDAAVIAATVTGTSEVPAPATSSDAAPTVTVVGATGEVPTPATSSDAAVTAATVTGLGSVEPAVGAPTTAVTATVVTGLGSVGAPTTSSDATVTPTVVTGVGSVPVPATSSDAAPTTTVVTGTSEVLAPATFSDAAVTATVVTGTSEVPAPAIALDTTVDATTVTCVGEVPAPVTFSDATVTPTVVTGVGSVPAPATFSDADPGSATVTGIGEVPAPATSSDATVDATVVTGVGEVPAPATFSDATVGAATVTGIGSVEPAVVGGVEVVAGVVTAVGIVTNATALIADAVVLAATLELHTTSELELHATSSMSLHTASDPELERLSDAELHTQPEPDFV